MLTHGYNCEASLVTHFEPWHRIQDLDWRLGKLTATCYFFSKVIVMKKAACRDLGHETLRPIRQCSLMFPEVIGCTSACSLLHLHPHTPQTPSHCHCNSSAAGQPASSPLSGWLSGCRVERGPECWLWLACLLSMSWGGGSSPAVAQCQQATSRCLGHKVSNDHTHTQSHKVHMYVCVNMSSTGER